MVKRAAFFALIVCTLAGCRPVDGTYSPGCMAHAGSRIHLSDGEFVWEKFTDQVSIDEDGNKIDAFPGYPRSGKYRIKGHEISMDFDDDDSTAVLQIHERDGQYLLLTDSQAEAWNATGRYDDCVLTREDEQ
jgi:hypothetical protein